MQYLSPVVGVIASNLRDSDVQPCWPDFGNQIRLYFPISSVEINPFRFFQPSIINGKSVVCAKWLRKVLSVIMMDFCSKNLRIGRKCPNGSFLNDCLDVRVRHALGFCTFLKVGLDQVSSNQEEKLSEWHIPVGRKMIFWVKNFHHILLAFHLSALPETHIFPFLSAVHRLADPKLFLFYFLSGFAFDEFSCHHPPS